ncbi:hypothetical protein [Nitrosomonas sp. Nm84]|uniref:hypothetical protein n=1 Tax=Nitrosomonas sp. Nm84 TaxID=200124 RepID=UPI001404B6A7|nr:hypothetical protein [Nitrosomonas sp. Nm84]
MKLVKSDTSQSSVSNSLLQVNNSFSIQMLSNRIQCRHALGQTLFNEARWVSSRGKSVFGYKQHTLVDDDGLVMATANCHTGYWRWL